MEEGDFEEVGFEHDVCPLCGEKLVPLRYLGDDWARLAKEEWVKEFEEPLYDANGMPVWVEKECGSSGRRWSG